jgi:ABC-type nitrate/sulfonate/bicarbonate transport system permease component
MAAAAGVLLAVAFPLLLLALWHFATVKEPTSLIPPPHDVWLELAETPILENAERRQDLYASRPAD